MCVLIRENRFIKPDSSSVKFKITYCITMSLYPSLEDMKVDTMARAQLAQYQVHAAPPAPMYGPPTAVPSAPGAHMYPALGNYMGLELSSDVIAQNMPEYQVQTVGIFCRLRRCSLYTIAFLSGMYVNC